MQQYLKELRDTWGYDTTELKHIRDLFEEIAFEAYWMGYRDRETDEERERVYYGGFSAYGKKEDWV